MKSDIIVIGGGAAGLLAALGAARTLATSENGGTVTVLEKMPKAARKLMITGKGRCNFTNVKPWEDFEAHICTDPNFVSPAWHNLTPEKLIGLLRENGLKSVIERGDRAFPESHRASDVVDTLVRACTLQGVRIVNGCEVRSITPTAKGFSLEGVLTTVKERRFRDPERPWAAPQVKTETTIEPVAYSCSKLIVATGGLSYPGTGSTGDGYRWAADMGHTLVPCLPSLTALVPVGYKQEPGTGSQIKAAFRSRTVYGRSTERKVAPLPASYPKFEKHIERITPLTDLGEQFNGNTLENVRLSIFIGGNESESAFGDIEFTDGGLEGPLGFQLSRKAVKALCDGQKVSAVIDLKPAVDIDKLRADIRERWASVKADPRSKGQPTGRLVRILLGKLIPWNLTNAFLRTNPRIEPEKLADALKNWKLDIAGFVGFERCVVTAGGISTGEVVAKTLESKKQSGLYFAGEVLDMDCDTGGYNLQTAFCTGYLAGESAAKSYLKI